MCYEIIITNRFKEKYMKWLIKYFTLNKFISVLKSKNHNFVSLHNPFEKYKIKINWVNFRGVVFILLWNKIIPLFIYLKKDKINWMNINWEKDREEIKKEHTFATNDIEKWLFEIF
jgi:hypothetical protein